MKRCLNCMNEYPDEYGDLCPSCGYMDGTTLNGSVVLQPGTILQARYIVGTVLRERDTDIIYIGWDALFDRRVQLQEYFPRYCATRSGKPELSIYDNKQEIYEKGLELFTLQSRQLIRLYKEEDIVTYHACFMENCTAYAVMEYSQDITLEKRLEGHRFSVNQAQAFLDMAMEAVMKVHEIGVFHGQIEPESFWERPDGSLVLKDFGAFRYVSGEPGIVDYGNAGTHTDVYGLAKMFCRLITGKDIEDGEKLESELSRKQIGLKKPVAEAIKHALLHKTRTVDAFQKELWGRKKVSQSRKEKKNHGSLALPRWLLAAAFLVVTGLLVFTGLVAAGKIDLRMQQGESQLEKGQIRVPNVINKSEKEAEKLLKKKGLTMNVEKKVYSDQADENMIFYQEPRENSIIDSAAAENTEIVVYISLGEEKAALPLIVGMDREDAVKALHDAGFTNIKEEDSQETGVFNSVLKVSKEQEAQVALTAEIVITVCKNETAQDGDTAVQVKVPDVIAMTEEKANAALKESGLQVNRVGQNSDQPEGTILEQDPKVGEEVNKNSFVTVFVSIGAEKVYMKNVELETREDAEKVIGELKLTAEITEAYSDTVAKGKVISQSIAIGEEVNPGDKVKLVISLGKDPAKTKKAPTKPKSTQAQPPALPPASGLPPVPGETQPPTAAPTLNETPAPIKAPTEESPAPTPAPTKAPTESPAPTKAPTESPAPTPEPTKAPQEKLPDLVPATEPAQSIEAKQPEVPAPTPAPVSPAPTDSLGANPQEVRQEAPGSANGTQ